MKATNEVKHTPGPWGIVIGDTMVKVFMGDPDSGEPFDEVNLQLYGGEDADADKVTIANARVMKAAPNLLKACMAIVDSWDVQQKQFASCDDPPNIRLARAAIAEATS